MQLDNCCNAIVNLGHHQITAIQLDSDLAHF